MPASKRTISLRVDAKTARRYRSASTTERQKFQTIVDLFFQSSPSTGDLLKVLMDNVALRAKKQGITPQIVRSLLPKT